MLIFSYHMWNGLTQGAPPNALVAYVKSVMWQTLKANWVSHTNFVMTRRAALLAMNASPSSNCASPCTTLCISCFRFCGLQDS